MSEELTSPGSGPESRQPGKTSCFVTGIAVIGTIIAIITGVLKIIEFVNSRSSKLTAEVSHTPFSAPPALLREREKLRTFTSKPEALEKALDLSHCDPANKLSIAINTARFLGDMLPFTAGDRFSDPTDVWFVDVKNNSESTCEAVTLTLPGAESVAIQREGKAVEYRDINEVFDIGDLKPKELVKITGWARTFIDEDKLKLVYKTGVGTIELKKPVNPDWPFISEIWSSCALELLMLLFVLIVAAIAIRKIMTGRKAASVK